MKLNLKNVFRNISLSVGIFAFALGVFGLVNTSKAEAFVCTAKASTAWNVGTTWNDCAAGGPVLGDTVNIPVGFVVNITGAAAAATTLHLVNGGGLTLSNTLSVEGVTTIDNSSTMATNGSTFTTGSLLVSGILDLGTGPSTVSTTTTINNGGIIRLSGNAGLKTFSTAVTISSGGTWEETAVDADGITLSTTLDNAGTMTISNGDHTFGGVITNTSTGILTTGTGVYTISAAINNTGVFNYAGSTDLTTLTTNASGTVNYTGGVQAVLGSIAYYNLGISGTASKTVPALVISNNFTITSPSKAILGGDSSAKSLLFGSTVKAKSSWGSTSSVAAHRDNNYFDPAGTYIVNVTTGPVVNSVITITDSSPMTTTVSADTTAPSGTSVSINAGVSTTSSLSSTLTFTAIDATEMMISNDAGFAGASWESYAGSKAWTLTTGDGVKTVYARFRDAVGNMSTAVIDAITVSGSGTVAVPSNEPTQGCSGGNLFNTSTGAVCTNNTVLQIPGCGNSATGFSISTGVSCVGNHVTTYTTTTYNFGTTTLKNGSKGEAVKELQRFLNAKLNLGLVIDGSLGPKTIAVIKKWQKDNGLVSDGLVGAKTKAMMNQ